MIIDSHDVSSQVFVIAEIGNNHEGDYQLAKHMITLAKEAGANAVKFQTIVPEQLVSSDQTQRLSQLQKFSFTYEQFAELAECAKSEGLCFLSTPFDKKSVAELACIVPAYKIASGDNNCFPLIAEVAQTGKPLIISTGLCDLSEIKTLVEFVKSQWQALSLSQDLALLHCVVNYPTALEEANLSVIAELQQLDVIVGYSDHTLGIEAVKAAVAMGARVIEKHFTLSKTHSDFRDHQMSADPEEFSAMVKAIRVIESMQGAGRENLPDNEKEIRPLVRRSVAADQDFAEGHVLSANDFRWLRPGTGFAPGSEEDLIGKKLKRDYKAGEIFNESDLV